MSFSSRARGDDDGLPAAVAAFPRHPAVVAGLSLGLGLLLTVALTARDARATPGPAVSEVPVEIHALRDVRVPAEVAGRVRWRVEDEAKAVRAGEVVVALDAVFLETAARAAAASAQRAQARRDWARLELRRVKDLYDKGSVGLAELDQADLALREAEASLAAAQARADEAKTRLERAEIRAPFDGKLVRVFPEVGEYLQVGQTAFRLVDDSRLKIVAYVPASWTTSLRRGDRLEVLAEAVEGTDRSVLRAQVFSVAAAAEGRARTFRVEARADRPAAPAAGAFWKPGTTAWIRRPGKAED